MRRDRSALRSPREFTGLGQLKTRARYPALIFLRPEPPAPLIYPPTLVDAAGWAQMSVAGKYFSDKCFVRNFLIAHPAHQAAVGVLRAQSGDARFDVTRRGPPFLEEAGGCRTPSA
jgi:hypothetical protein